MSTSFGFDKQGFSLKVKFREKEFFSLIRRKQLSSVEILSFVGGLLGLFAGFSVLSLMEAFYYFVIRVGYNIYSQKNKVHPIIISKNKVKEFKIVENVKLFVNEYLAASTIHGLKADGCKNWFSKYISKQNK